MMVFPMGDGLINMMKMKRRIIHLQQTDSTNRYLHDLPDDGYDLTAVYADFQTAGRGQGSNTWESEPGKNLLMSVRIRPTSVPPAEQFILSEAGALALGKALSAYTGDITLKWPNDITLKWPNDIYWRDFKISGTLIETAVSSCGISRCIYGIGLNVNQRTFLSDAPNPISLFQATGCEHDVEEVMLRVLDALEEELGIVAKGQYDDIRLRYHQMLYRRTGSHRYRDEHGLFEAEMVGVEDDGHLVLRDGQGRIREYAFKEVAFVIGQ